MPWRFIQIKQLIASNNNVKTDLFGSNFYFCAPANYLRKENFRCRTILIPYQTDSGLIYIHLPAFFLSINYGLNKIYTLWLKCASERNPVSIKLTVIFVFNSKLITKNDLNFFLVINWTKCSQKLQMRRQTVERNIHFVVEKKWSVTCKNRYLSVD